MPAINHQQRGYTLLETLLAVAIIATMAGLIVFTFDPLAQAETDLEEQALRLENLINQTSEDSVLMNVQYGIRIYADGYQVLQHGQIETASGPQPAWLSLDRDWAKQRLEKNYLLSVALNGDAFITPETWSDQTASNEERDQAPLPPPPHILLLSSGEATQAFIRITDTTNANQALPVFVAIDPLGRARVQWNDQDESL